MIKKGPAHAVLLGAAGCLCSACVTAALVLWQTGRRQLALWDALYSRVAADQPQAAALLLAALKETTLAPKTAPALTAYGYTAAAFVPRTVWLCVGAGFAVGMALLLAASLCWRRGSDARLTRLTAYLRRVNAGEPGALLENGEGAFAVLSDEVYKTVTSLRQTRDDAWHARAAFADNLANIAHQLKTPLAALSLTAEDGPSRRQLDRLTRLEEALLLLARMDAGTLPLQSGPVDAYTAFSLAADGLQTLLAKARVTLDLAETAPAAFTGDLHWTAEALTNLLKNCAEHAPAGSTIHCSYAENPLYTELCIRDEGPGFAPADLPRLFERFYRGQNAGPEGLGLGLAFAKELTERQGGTLRADNVPGGGARFVLRFYRH